MSNRRRTYPKQFKIEAVEFLKAHPEKTITEVAEELGIKRDILSRWNIEFLEDKKTAFPGKGNPRDEEFLKLRKENSELREEREILKKALAIFSKQKK